MCGMQEEEEGDSERGENSEQEEEWIDEGNTEGYECSKQ